MAYCTDPRNHRKAWWADPSGFEWFDWKRRKIVPSKTAWMHCEICHRHWGTTNRELIAKLPKQRPSCDGPHVWKYYDVIPVRQCQVCGTEQRKPDGPGSGPGA
jgi:hypothetical protein